MNDLSPAQRNQLQRLIKQLSDDESSADGFLFPLNATLQGVLEWAEQHYVLAQSPRHGSNVRVTTDWLGQIEQALLSQGYGPIHSTRLGDRIEQASQSVTEVKHMADSPTRNRVLLALRCSAHSLFIIAGKGLTWQITDVDWRLPDLDHYEHLIVVENLTVFYQLQTLHIEWPHRELIVYRGHERYHQGFSRLLSAWSAQGKPCYGMVDLDPYSIRMLQTGPYTHVAAPSLGRFKALACRAHAPAGQYGFAANLRAYGAFSPYIQHMQQQQVGLKQEWLHQEPLYWVSLID